MSPTLLFFAGTLFVSAFLLFLVQPMIGKMILPRLGGTPQVWNTCMVFFQTALLAGYAYTHTVSTRLKLRAQLILHSILLLVPLTVLFLFGQPFNVDILGTPPLGSNPIPWALALLTVVVGLPFFVVSTSAPLLQRWFAYTGDPAAKDPYFLYGASNLGSMLGLLLYPALVEPNLTLVGQAWTWAIGYGLLVVLVLGCAFVVLKAPPSVQLAGVDVPEQPPLPVEHVPEEPSTQVKAGPAPAPSRATGIKKALKGRARTPQPQAAPGLGERSRVSSGLFVLPETRSDEITWWRRLRWVGLAAVPSSLMLGITTYMSTDISAIPLFWVIPLALYLLTFILVFLRYPVTWTGTPHSITLIVQPFLLLALVYVAARHVVSPVWLSTLILVLAFFVTALMCHGELARDRPSTKHLTEFYLWMSVGGMVGGMFNGLVAPVIFFGLAELPIAIILACFLRPSLGSVGWTDTLLINWFPTLSDKGMAEEETEGTSLLKQEESTTYNTLHYTLDIVLPFAVAVFMALVLFNQRSFNSFFEELATKWFRLGEDWTEWMPYYGGLILTFGLPILFAFMFSFRPLRFGLAVAAIFGVNAYYEFSRAGDRILQRDRSYFGILRVQETKIDYGDGAPISAREVSALNEHWVGDTKHLVKAGQLAPYRYLMHGTTHHGLNFQSPPQLRRLATTYYHRFGPVGVAMEKLNWFPGPQNTYWADARMPVTLIAAGLQPFHLGGLPAAQLTALWSEPPYATIGLGTGTMASYARPFQIMHYYEIDDQILRYNLPAGTLEENLALLAKDPKTFGDDQSFNYLCDSLRRGANLEVLMGDARLRMGLPYVPLEEARKKMGKEEKEFYAQTDEGRALRAKARELSGGPDGFYRVIVVDAFSSDAIPVHLITEEGIKMYFDKMTPDGVLCVHTSNRHVDLVKPVTDVARKLGKVWRVGNDVGRGAKNVDGTGGKYGTGLRGHFQSEYVLLANRAPGKDEEAYLPPATPDGDDIVELYYSHARRVPHPLVWHTPRAPGMRVWTDDYSNLLSVFRWR